MTRRRKKQPDASEDEITEEVVEGIWAENQYKMENIEGYAEAFERLTNHIRKAMMDERELSDRELEDCSSEVGELIFLEMMHRLKP